MGIHIYMINVGTPESGGGGGLQKSTLAAILLSAVISALVARVGLKEELALRPAPYALTNPLVELPAYLGLGILSGKQQTVMIGRPSIRSSSRHHTMAL